MQKVNTNWRPVAFASCSMFTTEVHYAQIEKEALAITWICDKFSMYLLGRRFEIETDHKPLVPLLSSKSLDDLPPRILRFCLRMMRYDYSIMHVPGKSLFTADTLSRAPASGNHDNSSLQDETEAFVAELPCNIKSLGGNPQGSSSKQLIKHFHQLSISVKQNGQKSLQLVVI